MKCIIHDNGAVEVTLSKDNVDALAHALQHMRDIHTIHGADTTMRGIDDTNRFSLSKKQVPDGSTVTSDFPHFVTVIVDYNADDWA
jgi:hypothetical protein